MKYNTSESSDMPTIKNTVHLSSTFVETVLVQLFQLVTYRIVPIIMPMISYYYGGLRLIKSLGGCVYCQCERDNKTPRNALCFQTKKSEVRTTEFSSINKSCSHVLEDFSRVAPGYKAHIISGLCSRREMVKDELLAPQNWAKLAKDRHPYRKVFGPPGWGFWQWVSSLLFKNHSCSKNRQKASDTGWKQIKTTTCFTNKIAEVLEEISQLNISIIALSETKRKAWKVNISKVTCTFGLVLKSLEGPGWDIDLD
ncbi:hypothetical protein HHI36_018486 [Cryptolaemus montrouzieri]|uniref:Uncharacterized protein n=1 Tax=Cryptolaemus montrouzieri TaxID=559131 RepID=A0ABD2P0Y7_9CUCU